MASSLTRSTTVAGATLTWSVQGNLTSDGTRTFTYDAANRLTGTTGSLLTYDALDRLVEKTGTDGGRFQYDGAQLATVYNGAGVVTERYVGGPAPDEWAALWTGATTAAPQWPLQNYQASVIALTDATGAATSTLAYDEYGRPRAGNLGRFQYTGQMMLPDFGLQHYKARGYYAALGRFVQTDPVGYAQGLNLYAYVGNDPVNGTDPTGLYECEGNRGQCRRIADALARLVEAAERHDEDSDERAAIQAVVDYYGEEGDGGVRVAFVSGKNSPRIARFDPDAPRGETIYINSGAVNRLSLDVFTIGLGHEGWHGVQFEGGQRPGDTYAGAYDYEYSAYAIQYQIAAGLGWGGFTTETSYTLRRDAARRGARASAETYCARRSGGCRY